MIVETTADGVIRSAPAKLNLFLEVLGRRADGYHELETLMVRIDLADTLHLRPAPTGAIAFSCDDPTVPTGEANLVVRAAERLRQARGCLLGVNIHLCKKIPMQAGLGGGSSDAASALVGLDRLWELQTPSDQLAALAGGLGSDVPFFLHSPVAVCRGRGERVEAVRLGPSSSLRALWFVLVCPPFGLSTAAVFGRVQAPSRPRSVGPVLEALLRGDIDALGRELFNRLEGAAGEIQPALRAVRSALEAQQPALAGTLMSGSGSACLGLAHDEEAARRAADRLTGVLGPGLVRVVRADLESSPA